jgi:hypothetical protein
MSQLYPCPLEVTRALLTRAKAARFTFGDDTAIVAVQHMLRQTVDLFRTVAEMGVNAKNIFALGKVYSNSVLVMRTLKDMGVTVIDSNMPPPGEFHRYFRHDVERLWEVTAEAISSRHIKRIIVLDDAGVCITNVPSNILSRYTLCAVEQTTSGMFLCEEKPPPFAVMSWARAAVKLMIGGPVFAQSFVDKLNTKFLRGRSLHGERVGVVGLGSIGSGVANLAARQGNKVCFYDPDPDLQFRSSLHEGITRASSLEELMRTCDYVFGCSGRNPFRGKWPIEHRPGARLFSVSGGDQEFAPIIDDLKRTPDFEVEPDTWNIVSEDGPCGPIRIAYLGYPYNFVSRAPEAVPSRIVQLETGGLLAALMQARLHLDLFEKGKQDNRGVHRVSPRAQQFVYERWLRVMKERNINLAKVFDLDRATLAAAAEGTGWFIENTEHRTSLSIVEEMMNRIVSRPGRSLLQRNAEPNLSSVPRF